MLKNPPPVCPILLLLKSFCPYRACGAYTRNLFHYIFMRMYAHPRCLCQRTHKCYNVSFRIWVIKVFISVKMKLKNKLFCEKIWWNEK